MIQTPSFERIAQFPAAIGREDNVRYPFSSNRSEFRNGNLELSKQFEQERFECLVRSVNFIDQQHRGSFFVQNRLQERAPEKKARTKDIVFLFLDRFVASFLDFNG